MSFETRVANQIPILLESAEMMSRLSGRILAKLSTKMNDHFGVMSTFFLSKQHEHLKAILTLKEHRDSELIVRSMLEGLVQILWANGDHQRALDWRLFGHVYNFRQFRDNPGSMPDDPEVVKRHVEQLEALGDRFYTPKAKKLLASGEQLPADPYVQDWTGVSVKDLFNKVQGQALYDFYDRFSKWHHWAFAGISRALDITNPDAISYNPSSPVSAAHALVVGFQCLFQTADIANQYFKLGFDQELVQLRLQHFKANESFRRE